MQAVAACHLLDRSLLAHAPPAASATATLRLAGPPNTLAPAQVLAPVPWHMHLHLPREAASAEVDSVNMHLSELQGVVLQAFDDLRDPVATRRRFVATSSAPMKRLMRKCLLGTAVTIGLTLRAVTTAASSAGVAA
jgi:hypothetical protein